MAYIDKNGNQKFSLKEKVAYHNDCANTGKDANGNKLTFAQRAHHAQASARAARKLNKFKQQEEFACSVKPCNKQR